MAVPSQGDPVVAITCISHPSSQATAKPQPAAPAAELQLEGLTGDDDGMEGGLEGELEGSPSAETAAPAACPGRAHQLWPSVCIFVPQQDAEVAPEELQKFSFERVCGSVPAVHNMSVFAGATATAWLKLHHYLGRA